MFNREKLISDLENKVAPKYKFMRGLHSDGKDKRCAIGGIFSAVYGWDGYSGERYGKYGYMCEDLKIWKNFEEDFGRPDEIGLSALNDCSKSWEELIRLLKEGKRGYYTNADYEPGIKDSC